MPPTLDIERRTDGEPPESTGRNAMLVAQALLDEIEMLMAERDELRRQNVALRRQLLDAHDRQGVRPTAIAEEE